MQDVNSEEPSQGDLPRALFREWSSQLPHLKGGKQVLWLTEAGLEFPSFL